MGPRPFITEECCSVAFGARAPPLAIRQLCGRRRGSKKEWVEQKKNNLVSLWRTLSDRHMSSRQRDALQGRSSAGARRTNARPRPLFTHGTSGLASSSSVCAWSRLGEPRELLPIEMILEVRSLREGKSFWPPIAFSTGAAADINGKKKRIVGLLSSVHFALSIRRAVRGAHIARTARFSLTRSSKLFTLPAEHNGRS